MKNRYDIATVDRVTSLIVKALQAGAIIILSAAVAYFSITQRTVMQPPFKIDRPMVLDWDEEIDRETIEKMGELLTTVLKNVTPKNVQKQQSKILPLVPAAQYDKVESLLAEDAISITRNSIVRMFHVGHINTDKKGEVTVTGVERLSVKGKQISKVQMAVTWLYDFTPIEGFVILGYKEVREK